MKKTLLFAALIMATFAMAKPIVPAPGKPEAPATTPVEPVQPAPIEVPENNTKVPVIVQALISPIIGAALLPGLVIGDAQWQAYTNRGNCDTRHFIITLVPTPKNRENFGLSVKIPCSAWFEKN